MQLVNQTDFQNEKHKQTRCKFEPVGVNESENVLPRSACFLVVHQMYVWATQQKRGSTASHSFNVSRGIQSDKQKWLSS